MTTPFRPSLRLKPSILSLFVLLTVPVLAVIIVVNYVSNDRIARVKGQELVERFRLEAIDSVREIFEPIKSMVRVAAMLGDTAERLLRRQPLDEVLRDDPPAQPEDRLRLCRPE